MEFRILGPLELYNGQDRVDVSRAKPRALLAMLLLHRNQTVAADGLIDPLWDSRPPATALNTLQMHVSYLRKCLAVSTRDDDAGVSLQTHAAGYSLIVHPDQVDARRFERLIAEARESRRASEPKAAVDILRSALSLWRGAAMAGFADTAFAAGRPPAWRSFASPPTRSSSTVSWRWGATMRSSASSRSW
jgi:DNA-binding SARP family transcriptional activator